MRYRPDTQEGVNELKMMKDGERVYWIQESPKLKRNLTIYPEMLSFEQRQRLGVIWKELLIMSYDASEETITKTVLKETGLSDRKDTLE